MTALLLAFAASVIVVGPDESAAAALARARDGDRVVLRGGVHRERLRVERAVSLEGEDGAVLDGGGEGSVLVVAAGGARVSDLHVRGTGGSHVLEDSGVLVDGAPGVRLERVTVDDALFGIHVRHSPGTLVSGCRVRGRDLHVARRGDAIRVFASPASRIQGCLIEDTRDVIVWYSEGSSFLGNTVRRARYGLHLMNTADARCEGNLIEDASVGIFSMYSQGVHLRGNRIGPVRGPSGYAIGLKDTDAFEIAGNLLGDARVGIFFDGSPLRPDKPGLVRGNHVVWCDVGLSFMPAVRGVTVAGNALRENATQVEIRGGGKLEGNMWGLGGRGNFWSDYEGFDADGDGVGEVPYRALSLYEALVDTRPDLKLFEGSPAARAIDWGARVAPVFAPDAKVEDPWPLLVAPPVPDVPGGSPPGGSPRLLGLGTVLASLGAFALLGLGRIA